MTRLDPRLAFLAFVREAACFYRVPAAEAARRRRGFYSELALLSAPLVRRSSFPRRAFYAEMARLGTAISVIAEEGRERGLSYFESHVIPSYLHLRWRLVGATVERRAGLSLAARKALTVLELHPDLMSALDQPRTETAYSHLVANLMRKDLFPGIAESLLHALVVTIFTGSDDDEPPGISGIRVTAEDWLDNANRLDVRLSGPEVEVFVEMKIDSGLGVRQLERYQEHLDALDRCPSVRRRLVLLSPRSLWPKKASERLRMLDYDDLLRAWLPVIAASGTDDGHIAGSWLKSVALHLCEPARCDSGPFDAWPLSTRRRALELLKDLY